MAADGDGVAELKARVDALESDNASLKGKVNFLEKAVNLLLAEKEVNEKIGEAEDEEGKEAAAPTRKSRYRGDPTDSPTGVEIGFPPLHNHHSTLSSEATWISQQADAQCPDEAQGFSCL